MPEPTLVERERELLRLFRDACSQRAQAESDAEAQRKVELNASAAEYNKVRTEADDQLDKTKMFLAEASDSFRMSVMPTDRHIGLAGVDRDLFEYYTPGQPTVRAGINPASELALRVTLTRDGPSAIRRCLRALHDEQDRSAKWRSQLILIGMIALIVAVFVGIYIAGTYFHFGVSH